MVGKKKGKNGQKAISQLEVGSRTSFQTYATPVATQHRKEVRDAHALRKTSTHRMRDHPVN